MSTYEATIEMLNLLSDDDLEAINGIVKRLVFKSQSDHLNKRMTKDSVLSELAISRKQYEEEKVQGINEALAEIGAKYGF